MYVTIFVLHRISIEKTPVIKCFIVFLACWKNINIPTKFLTSPRQETSKKWCFSRSGNTREVSIGRQRSVAMVCRAYLEHLPLISYFWFSFLLFSFLLFFSLLFFRLSLSGSSLAGRLLSEMKEQVFSKEFLTDDRCCVLIIWKLNFCQSRSLLYL